MNSGAAFQVAAFFLVLNVCFLSRYLWRKNGYSWRWLPLSPASFVIGSLTILAVSAEVMMLTGSDGALFAAAIASGSFFSLIDPVFGLCFFCSCLVIRPWELSAGTGSAAFAADASAGVSSAGVLGLLPRLLAAIVILSWLFHSIRKRKFEILLNWPVVLYVLFVFWLALSALLVGEGEGALKDINEAFLPTTAICFLILNTVKDSLDLEALTGTLLISIGAVVIMAIVISFGDSDFWNGTGRLSSQLNMGNANDLAALIVAVTPFLFFGRFAAMRGAGRRSIIVFLVLSFICGLWLAQSRGALLSLAVMCLFWLLFCVGASSRALRIGLVLLFVPLILFGSMTRQEDEQEMSKESRVNYVVTGIKMFKTSPVAGVGYGNYPRLYNRFSSLFVESGERTAHSSWILVLAEAGLVGFILFVTLYASVLSRAWRVRRPAPQYLLAVAGYGVAISFLSHSYLSFPYMLLSLIIVGSKIDATSLAAA